MLSEILRKLTRYAEESDSEAFEYLESTREELAAACPPEVFEKLRSSLRSYDFSVALETLRTLSLKRLSMRRRVKMDMNRKRTVLVIDDTPEDIAILNEELKVDYRVQAATDHETAMKLMRSTPRRISFSWTF